MGRAGRMRPRPPCPPHPCPGWAHASNSCQDSHVSRMRALSDGHAEVIITFSIFGFMRTQNMHSKRNLIPYPTVHTRCRESKYQKSYDHFLGPSESARIRLTCESWHEFEKKFGRSNRSGRGGAYHGANRTSGGGAPGLAGLGRLGGARVRAKVPVTLLAQGSRGHESELKIFKRIFFRFSTKFSLEIAKMHQPE